MGGFLGGERSVLPVSVVDDDSPVGVRREEECLGRGYPAHGCTP